MNTRMIHFAFAVGTTLLVGCARSSKTIVARDVSPTSRDQRRLTESAQNDNAKAVELIKSGKLDDAEKLLKKALDEDVMYGPAHNNLGKIYFDHQQYYLAAWEFQYAQKLMPNQPEPRNNLGLVFEAVGKLSEAVTSYDTAMDLEPDNAEFIGNAVRARVRRGDRGPAVKDLLQKLIERDTRSDWVEWARQLLKTTPWNASTSPTS